MLFAIAASAVLFWLQEQVLAYTNREADRLNRIIRGYPAQTFGASNRRWLVGQAGDIYHYEFFDPRPNRFSQSHDLPPRRQRVAARRLDVCQGGRADAAVRRPTAARSWHGTATTAGRGSSRRAAGTRRQDDRQLHAVRRARRARTARVFQDREPDAEKMTYGQLKRLHRAAAGSGFNVGALHGRSCSGRWRFRSSRSIMTLLAVPFAVTTGRRGALYGIGIGIVLAIVYWIDAEHLRRARRRWCASAAARRLGAEHPLRRRRRVHDPDGQNVDVQVASCRIADIVPA